MFLLFFRRLTQHYYLLSHAHAPSDTIRDMKKYAIGIVIATLLFGVFFIIKGKDVNQDTQFQQDITTPSLKSSEFAGSPVTMTGFGMRLFDIKIPDGWVVKKSSFNEGLVFADQLEYKPGTKFTLTDEKSSLSIARFNASWGESSEFPDEYDIFTKKALPSVNGHSAEFYEHTFAKDEKVGSYIMRGGEKEYVYRILNGDYEVVVSYFVLDGDEENRDLIESVVSTVKIQ